MAVTLKRVRVANPARRRSTGRRKLSPAQIKAGFGGKRRKIAAKTKRRHTRRPVAKVSKPARRRVARRKNIGEIVSIGLGNPAASSKGQKTVARKAKKRTNRARRSPVAVTKRRRRNPARALFMKSKRRATRRRNPAITANLTGMITKAAYVVGGLVGARGVTQLAFSAIKNPAANAGILGYVSNIVAAFVIGGLVGKFRNREVGNLVTIGGLAGVVARAVSEYAPGGSYVRAQLAGLGDYGLGLYLPTQFAVPGVPVDSNAGLPSAASMQNPWPVALPAPANSMNGLAGRGDTGLAGGGRYSTAGRYN